MGLWVSEYLGETGQRAASRWLYISANCDFIEGNTSNIRNII